MLEYFLCARHYSGPFTDVSSCTSYTTPVRQVWLALFYGGENWFWDSEEVPQSPHRLSGEATTGFHDCFILRFAPFCIPTQGVDLSLYDMFTHANKQHRWSDWKPVDSEIRLWQSYTFLFSFFSNCCLDPWHLPV